jgi:hypothetical protein
VLIVSAGVVGASSIGAGILGRQEQAAATVGPIFPGCNGLVDSTMPWHYRRLLYRKYGWHYQSHKFGAVTNLGIGDEE